MRSDVAGIQFKVLNQKKGAAVRGHRAQIDRELYQKHMLKEVLGTKNLTIEEDEVEDLILLPHDSHPAATCGGVLTGISRHCSPLSHIISMKLRSISLVTGPLFAAFCPTPAVAVAAALTASGKRIASRTTVITTGTFLRGRICIGLNSFPAGRMGMPSAYFSCSCCAA